MELGLLVATNMTTFERAFGFTSHLAHTLQAVNQEGASLVRTREYHEVGSVVKWSAFKFNICVT